MIKDIISEQFDNAKIKIKEKLDEIIAIKFASLTKTIGERILDEANVIRQGRTKLIRRRIRKGKLQRNIRKSAVKGFTLRRGKLKRITAMQKIKMRRVQKRAAIKRRAHMQSTLRKRRRSLMRRKTMGIR
jgi:hypothetical protein